MGFMPPSIEQLKQEIGIATLEEGGLNELLIKEKELKLELKELQGIIKVRKEVITEIMIENDVSEVPLGDDFTMQIIKGGTRRKVMSAKDIDKKYPRLLVEYPDLVTTVKAKDQMRIVVKK